MGKILTKHEVKDFWANFLLNKPQKDYLTLYISIPTCFEKCSFCIYYRYPFVSESQLDSYLDYLEKEASFFSKTFENSEFNAFYIGGGTPSLLRSKQISRLFSILRANFNINTTDNNFCGFEAHPVYFNDSKIDAVYRERMVNRVSFGVQSFDKEIVEQNSRVYIPIEKFGRLVHYIRNSYQNTKLNINADLMIGLENESIESLFFSFSTLANLNILRITVYCNRNKERKYGQAFQEYAINTIRSLNEYIEQNHPQYVKLFDNPSEYSEVHVCALSEYKEDVLKYSYNSSPLAYNNNLGLGLGSSSYIIEDDIYYYNSDGTYILNDIETSKTFTKSSKLRRKDNKEYINSFNF